jgi:hypothetical protein
MIPAFHCVLDLHVGDHDDPQHFDIAAWSDALQERIVTLHNVDAPHPTMRVMAAVAAADDFSTPTARSRTKSGKGGSKTTGLRGKLLQPAQGVEVIDATETLTAFRDGHALGDARTVRQVRTKKDGKTLIEQPDYCCPAECRADREFPGIRAQGRLLRGKSHLLRKKRYGGRRDWQRRVRDCADRQQRLRRVAEKGSSYLGRTGASGCQACSASDRKGLRAVVEVFFPATGRLARLPLVDVGPGTTGPAKTAIADLTVAAAAFLQRLTERDIKKLDNIKVQARIVA